MLSIGNIEKWKCDGKRSTATGDVCGSYSSTMKLHSLFYNVKSKSGTCPGKQRSSGGVVIAPAEAFENVGKKFWRDPFSGVRNAKEN